MPLTYDVIEFTDLRKGKGAIRKWTIRMEMPSGVSVSASGHTITHTPPSGGATLTSPNLTITSSSNNVTIFMGVVDVVGLHYLLATVVLSNSEQPQALLHVEVPF